MESSCLEMNQQKYSQMKFHDYCSLMVVHHFTPLNFDQTCMTLWYSVDPASSLKYQWKATAQESQRTLSFLQFGQGTTGNEIESCYVFC